MTVNTASTLGLASGSGAQNQSVATGVAITPTVYTYGGSETGVSVSGLPTGLGSSVNATLKTVTISGTPAASGTYTITTTGNTAPCATAQLSGTITVTGGGKPVLTVTAVNKNKHYGDNNPDLTYTITGFVNGENLATSGVRGRPSLSTTARRSSNAGTYPITITQGTLTSSKYNFTFVNGTLTIGKFTLTVDADNLYKHYGELNPSPLTYHITGFVMDQTLGTSGVTGSPQVTTAATQFSPAGSYSIITSIGTLSALNYDFTFLTGTLTVYLAHVTITPNANQTKVYGSANPLVYTYTSTGLFGNDHFNGQIGRVSEENVGTYGYTIGSLSAGSNYTLTVASSPTFRITQLPVTVTAAAKSKILRSPDPALTYTWSITVLPVIGSTLPNGQTVTFSGSLACQHPERVGTYPITIGTLRNSNYTISFVSKNLTILSRNNNITVSETEAVNPELKGEFELGLKAYPNPFTDHLYFDLQLQNDAKVILEVYNINGVKLARIFSEDVKGLSDYRIEYRPENAGTGILIYRLFINGKLAFTGKAIHQ